MMHWEMYNRQPRVETKGGTIYGQVILEKRSIISNLVDHYDIKYVNCEWNRLKGG